MSFPEYSDVVVFGGDLPALIFAHEAARDGNQVVVLASGALGTGPATQSHGALSFGNTVGVYEIEHKYGHGVARETVGLAHYIVDWIEDILRQSDLHCGLSRGNGDVIAHGPMNALRMRNEHEARKRHGSELMWKENVARTKSAVLSPHSLAQALMSELAEMGAILMEDVVLGRVRSKGTDIYVETDIGVISAGNFFNFEPKQKVIYLETLVMTQPVYRERLQNTAWQRNAFPLFDYAVRAPVDRWVLGSRRSWRISGSQHAFTEADILRQHQELVCEYDLKVDSVWDRPFYSHDESLPYLIKDSEHQYHVENGGHWEFLWDVFSADLALHELRSQVHPFHKFLLQLPEVDANIPKFLERFIAQAQIDDALMHDLQHRALLTR
ncbi:MAG: FAD-dependent oxidoreductase [bacterium]|nr:FAD-dependent oxidoreductase [bacterium]